jgi:hypothetical protein
MCIFKNLNMKKQAITLLIVLLGTWMSAQTKVITMESLLEEMTDRSSLSYYPSPNYTCKQFSSYSRDSKTKDTAEEDGQFKPAEGRDWGKGWFENHDFSQYIRKEENQGRKEDVMFDAKGPGAIVRFWATFGGVPDEYGGIYRVYIDGNPEPVIEMHNKNMLGKAGLVGRPFSFFAPEKAQNPTWRGRNLILPIPYAKSCKITYDGEHKYAHLGGWRGHYYQINYRTYSAGTKVESFTMASIGKYKSAIDTCGKQLVATSEFDANQKVENQKIQPDKELAIRLKGEKAITGVLAQLDAENINQALRSTVVSIEFDGQQTVWCPIGQFFGIGYKVNPHQTYYISADDQGIMQSQWVMPFKKKAVVRIKNLGAQDVTIKDLELETDEYAWKDNSMYFHATWKETKDLSSENRLDYNYVTINGKGVFVGDNLTLFNTFPDKTGINWWGEGDEKIYVDGEDFPSHFGTGTEDYYSYAWCRPDAFSAPNVSQPCGEGNKTPGHTSNNRYRLLDAIPFTSSFQFDMEIWHPYRAEMDYAPATFYYALPGAGDNIQINPEAVNKPVKLDVN